MVQFLRLLGKSFVMNGMLRVAPLACALITMLFFGACSKDKNGNQPPVVVTNAEKNEMNIAYGDHPYQKMDVLFPEGYTEATPVVFLIHGGGFLAGLKEDFATQAELFRKEGFVTVNISHRLVDTTGLLRNPPKHQSSNIKIADELADVDAAVSLYSTKASDWKTGTGKMYMAGHSAGAILAMLYTMGSHNESKRIRACANWAGVTDLSIPHDSLLAGLDPRWIEAMYRAVGVMPETANNLYFMAVSPYWVANNRGGMPAISIYPQENETFEQPGEAAYNLMQTQKFHKLLENKGHKQQLSVYAGSDHGFSRPAGSWERLIRETAVFFKDN